MSNLLLPSLPGLYLSDRAPLFDTGIQKAKNARQMRTANRTQIGYRYSFKADFLRPWAPFHEDDILNSFFSAHRGGYDTFLLQDPYDYQVTDHGFGVGDGVSTKFQLQRMPLGTYTDSLGTWGPYTKPRTNYALQSGAFDNASWTKRGAHVVTANAAIAPDGTISAELVTATAGGGNQGVYQDTVTASNGALDFSIWLKAGSLTVAQMCVKDRATDLVRGTVSLTLTNKWQRFDVSGVTAGGFAGARVEFNGVGSGTFYAWGAQLEPGAAATAYISTTAAAVRADPLYWTVDQASSALVTPALGSTFDLVTEPLMGDGNVYKDGVAVVPGTDYALSSNGLVTFTVAPAAAAVLSWTGSFLRRVKFVDDDLPLKFSDGVYRGDFDIETVVY